MRDERGDLRESYEEEFGGRWTARWESIDGFTERGDRWRSRGRKNGSEVRGRRWRR